MATVVPAPLAPPRRRRVLPTDDALEAGVARVRPLVAVAALAVAVLDGAAAGARVLLAVALLHVAMALACQQARPALRRATSAPAALADAVVTAGLVAATGGGASVLAALGPLQGVGIGLRFRPPLAAALGVVATAAFAVAIEATTPHLAGGWTVATAAAAVVGAALARRWSQERRRLQEAGRCAASATQRHEDLLRVLCHELRTPITSLTALSRAVGGSAPMPPDARRRALDLVERHADHLAGVLDEVRAFADAAEAGRPLADEACDLWLPDLVEGAAEAADLAPDQLDLEVQDAVAVVRLDRVKVRQVLTNLLENARRHGAADAPVVVRVRASAGGVRLVVANAGRDPADPAEGGSGLGLAIVTTLVDAMGGRLAEAPWGDGVRVTVDLPTSGTAPTGQRLARRTV